MKKAILGKKLGMMQMFAEDGTMHAVTVVEAGPCPVVQKKTVERDGYSAVQVGFGTKRERLVNKPMTGHFKKGGVSVLRYLREFKFDDDVNFEVGQNLEASIFAIGDSVDVSGISKGKGFSGVIKRFNQSKGRMSHGAGQIHRHPGAMSACAYPGKVFKNRNLPGHMGNENVTTQNLKIVRVDDERNLLLIKGAVPGPKGGLVTIKQSVKSK